MITISPAKFILRLRRSFHLRKEVQIRVLVALFLLFILSLSFWNSETIRLKLVSPDDEVSWVLTSTNPLKLYPIDTVVLDESHTITYTVGSSSKLASLNLPKLLESLLVQKRIPEQVFPLIEGELRANLHDEKWISSHWFQLEASKIWLQSEEVYFVTYLLLYVPEGSTIPERKEKKPLVSFIYVEFHSDTGSLLKDYTYNGLQYPTILPLKSYNLSDEKIKSHGPFNLKLLYTSTESGAQQPIIVFNSYASGSSKLFWIEPGKNDLTWEPKTFNLKVSNAVAYNNWIPFFDRNDPNYSYDTHISFVYHMSVDDIIKCSLDNGVCKVQSNGNLLVDGFPKFVDHTPLLSVKSLLPLSQVDFSKIKDVVLGFSNLVLEQCGCGAKMFRPTMVVYVKDNHNTMHIVQMSQMLDFNVEVANWNHLDQSSDHCNSISWMKAHSLETVDNQLKVMVTTSATIPFEITVVNIFKEISKGLSFLDNENWSPPDVETVIQSSQNYCKLVSKSNQDYAHQENTIADYDDNEANEEEPNDTDLDDIQLILYPNYIKNPEEHYKNNFLAFDSSKQKILQLGLQHHQEDMFNDFMFKSQPIHLYDTFTDLEDNITAERCSTTHKDFSVGYSEPVDMTGDFSDFISKYIHRDLTLSKDEIDYFFEYEGFLESRMEEMMKDKKSINKYWFCFGGASVYFEEFGIYLMLSRVIYAADTNKNKPTFSMTFLQVFNKDWKELNVEMVVPDAENPSGGFNRFRYPGFARIASYHDSSVSATKCYGPEDPRILIRKNHLGHEEPMIIFTQMQREITKAEGSEVSFKEYRTMFYTLPWEVQVGKNLVDPLLLKSNRNIYSKTVELNIYDQDTQKFKEKRAKEKNWTPFFSPQDRTASNGIDTSVYFVYLWEYLHILKCEIPYGQVSISKCITAFHNKPQKDFVGSFRGGTQLISANDLISNLPKPYNELKQEYWIGFARSHIGSCGCGLVMYRPQVAIISRSADGLEFQISHVSSFLGFEMEILPYSSQVCKGPNVFLPNGLSRWQTKSANGKIDDVVTLFYTLSDQVQGRFLIRGLLSELLRMNAFEWKGRLSTLDGRLTDPYYVLSHIKCSEIESREFCRAYGLEHPNV